MLFLFFFFHITLRSALVRSSAVFCFFNRQIDSRQPVTGRYGRRRYPHDFGRRSSRSSRDTVVNIGVCRKRRVVGTTADYLTSRFCRRRSLQHDVFIYTYTRIVHTFLLLVRARILYIIVIWRQSGRVKNNKKKKIPSHYYRPGHLNT